MRIGWFTPFAPESAIAEYSEHVTTALAASAEVELWVTAEDEVRDTALPLHRLSEERPELEGYDVCVYQYGDHPVHYAAIHEVATRHPGVIVLHDRTLQNLFADLWIARDRDPARYIERMATWYGDEGLQAAEDSVLGQREPVWTTDEGMARFPLLEEAMQHARGAVVHSRRAGRDVRERSDVPVAELFLPSYPTDWGERPPRPAPVDDRVRLLTVGYVNRNKRILELVHELGRDADLARRVRYVVAGPLPEKSSYPAEVRAAIVAHGLEDTVQLTGWLTDEALAQEMAAADVFVNLRWPTLEGASASLMRELTWAKPVVVFDGGAFEEFADGAVVKVAPEDYRSLVADLRTLAADAELRASIGRAGAEAARALSTDRYAIELLAFLDGLDRTEPLLALADRVADELSAFGVDPRFEVVDRIAAQIARMEPR